MERHAKRPYTQNRAPLPGGTSLHRRYSALKPIRDDGCTIAYEGVDYVAHQPVTILEFFPADIAVRTEGTNAVSPGARENGELYFLGMEAFYRQYDKLLQTIGSPSILSIFDAFFENGTAYAIAEQPEGATLTEYLGMHGRSLSDGECVYILRALADALLVVHSCNILHHGVSCDSILLCTDGTVKLADFAAGRRTVTSGRAVRDDMPWTDVRALGEALRRAYAPGAGSAAAPRPLIALLDALLSEDASSRCASVFDLRHMVDGVDIPPVRPDVSPFQLHAYRRLAAENTRPSAPNADMTRDADAPDASAPRRRSLLPVIAIGAVLLGLICVLIWALLRW